MKTLCTIILVGLALLLAAPAGANGPLPEGKWWRGMDYPEIISTLKQARAYHMRVVKLDGTQVAQQARLEGVKVDRVIAEHRRAVKKLAVSIRDKENEYDSTLAAIRETQAALNNVLDSAATAGWSVWDDLAGCEASGDWSLNTGNDFYGGLQFTYGTWTGNGGADFDTSGPFPFSREQQIAVAESVLASQGWGAWPLCSLKLGLR